MSLISSLGLTPMVSEIKSNPRLQWMLILIAIIVMLSLSKSYYDLVQEAEGERSQQFAMYQRILSVSSQPLDEQRIGETDNAYSELISKIPTAVSDSVAQAKALTSMEQIIQGKIERARVNVVSSENLQFGARNAWQVRLNVAGQMPEIRLIDLLANVSGNNPSIRLLSFQYNPKLSNTLTFVVDYLYVEEQASES